MTGSYMRKFAAAPLVSNTSSVSLQRSTTTEYILARNQYACASTVIRRGSTTGCPSKLGKLLRIVEFFHAGLIKTLPYRRLVISVKIVARESTSHLWRLTSCSPRYGRDALNSNRWCDINIRPSSSHLDKHAVTRCVKLTSFMRRKIPAICGHPSVPNTTQACNLETPKLEPKKVPR